jgi:CheY-like chemotaxis protein/ABC-type nitrate/sulfonate/bicarbonate transport system substrate-binding protein
MSEDRSLKILLVDDSGMARTMISNTIKSVGRHEISTATDGIDAVQRLQSGAPVDCVISDWNMPSMDGLAFLKWLRGQEGLKNLPFIMATAQSDKKQVGMALAAGANQVLAKPFSTDELRQALNAIFGPSKAAEASAFQLQYAGAGRLRLRVAHTASLELLTVGALSLMTRRAELSTESFELKAMNLPNLNAVQSSLENGRVDAAFVPLPLAMDLFGFGLPLRLVCLSGRNGGQLVRNKHWSSVHWPSHKEYFKYKAVLIPHKMSLYNMLLHRFLKEEGLRPGVPGVAPINVRFEVMPPIKMPEFMAYNEDVAAFACADPMGALAVRADIATPMFPTSELWRNHPGEALVVREECLAEHPESVRELVRLLFEAGARLADDPDKAAALAVDFLDPHKTLRLDADSLEHLLIGEQALNTRDLTPIPAELESIQDYLYNEMDIGGLIDVSRLVDTSFAEQARG